MYRGYPHWARPANFISLSELVRMYGPKTGIELDALSSKHVVAGRISNIRVSSKKLCFVDLQQDSYRSQLILNRKAFGSNEEFEAITNGIRRGDIVEASGNISRSLTGELSIKVNHLRVLTPCHVNLPDGPLDVENKMRHRHLDMLSSPEHVKLLKARSKVIHTLREYLDALGYTEVETTILSTKYGGANASPFETKHMGLHQLYMRIAPELSLKQLVVGGLDRCYELGKVFRNEGLDADHNPEFTSCEFYEAYANAEDMMKHVEELMKRLVELRFGADFGTLSFRRVDVVAELEAHLGGRLPFDDDTEAAKRHLLELSTSKGFDFLHRNMSLAKIYDKLISKLLEPNCIEPTFLVGHPMALSPLAKSRPNSPHIADRFELFVDGSELANGFSEQNDPDLQLGAFMEQARAKAQGDAEAQCLDEDFVQILRAGLPPTAGCGIGIDRLVMYLTGKQHIRDVLSFPMLRAKST